MRPPAAAEIERFIRMHTIRTQVCGCINVWSSSELEGRVGMLGP